MSLCLLASLANAVAAEKSILHEILDRGVVRIGWSQWTPYCFLDTETGELKGIFRDVGEELAKGLEVRVEFVQEAGTATLIAGSQARKYDVTLQLATTLPRAKVVEFTNPLLNYQASLMVKEGSLIEKWEDANDPQYTIGCGKGTNTALYVEKMFPKATVSQLQGIAQGVLAMKAGRIEVYATSYDTLLRIAAENPGLRVLKDPFVYSPMGFTVTQGDQIFINWLNWFIMDLKISRTIHRILEKHGARADMVAEVIYR